MATKTMANKKPKAKEKKSELIDMESALVRSALFTLKEIKMKDDFGWRIKLILKTKLEHTYREYFVKFSVNEEPFEMRIEDLERKKQQVQDDAQMALDDGMSDSARNKQIQNIDKEIEDVKAELESMLSGCPTIEFDGVIEELKYKYGETHIIMWFPSDSLKELNEHRKMLAHHYKIELIRE